MNRRHNTARRALPFLIAAAFTAPTVAAASIEPEDKPREQQPEADKKTDTSADKAGEQKPAAKSEKDAAAADKNEDARKGGPVSRMKRADKREDKFDRRENRRDWAEDKRDSREDRFDRREDARDRREDMRDAKFDGGRFDRMEDRFDAMEDRRDAREDMFDRREDRWDAREDVFDRREDLREDRREFRRSRLGAEFVNADGRPRLAAFRSRFDHDGDGQLSRREFMNSEGRIGKYRKRLVDDFDADGDGEIAEYEWEAMLDERRDAFNARVMSREERMRQKVMQRKFEREARWAANGPFADEVRRERTRRMAVMEHFDFDADGSLGDEEIQALRAYVRDMRTAAAAERDGMPMDHPMDEPAAQPMSRAESDESPATGAGA